MTGLLDYVPGGTFLHRLNPLVKLLLAAVLCASCFISRNHVYVLAIITLNLCLSAGSHMLGRSLRVLYSLVKFSLVLFTVQILCVRQGNVLFRFPVLTNVFITDRGLAFSTLFVLRLLAATMPLTIMLSVTRMSDISNALVRSLGIPFKYTFALTTALRFIPLFANEMSQIMEAQMSRGVRFDTKNFFKKIALLLPLCAPLLVSSVRKIEGAAISAELRGFNLRTRQSGYKEYGFHARDTFTLVLCAAVLVTAVMI